MQAIDVATVFRTFEDYWQPHVLGGSGIAQRYVSSLEDGQRVALRARLRSTLPIAEDGTNPLMARAGAVSGSTA